MKKINYSLLAAFFLVIALMPATSALSIDVTESPTLAPGEEAQIRVELENIFDEDAEDISLNLNFQNLPLTPTGSSEQSIDQIDQDDEEIFVFTIRASSDAPAGDYEIPYTLSYTIDNDEKSKTGTIGVKISSNPELSFSVETENAIVGSQGQVNIQIINKGLSDARFVSLRVLPQGFTLLSDSNIYIGTVDSDDFETAVLDVIFNDRNADLTAIVEYRDFDNSIITKNINLPLTVYTRERALELGLIKKSNLPIYITAIVILIIIIIIWRILKKRRRIRKSMNKE